MGICGDLGAFVGIWVDFGEFVGLCGFCPAVGQQRWSTYRAYDRDKGIHAHGNIATGTTARYQLIMITTDYDYLADLFTVVDDDTGARGGASISCIDHLISKFSFNDYN